MARFDSNSPYIKIDFNVSGLSLNGDWPNISFHFDCDFNYYCPTAYASEYYNNVNFNTTVPGYNTETKTENVAFNITAGQVSSRYGANYYNPGLSNARQLSLDVHAWISNGTFTGGGYATVTSPQIGNPSNLKLTISNITENSCMVTHSLTNNRNYWYVRLWDRNTNTYYNLNTNNGNGITTITGLKPNTEYKFELWACGRDGNYYYGSYPSQTITTLGKSSIGNNPSFTIGNSFTLDIQGYSDEYTHEVTFGCGGYGFKRSELKRGIVSITPDDFENESLYRQMTNSVTKEMSIALETFIAGKSIGTNFGKGTVNIDQALCAPKIKSYRYKDIDPISLGLSENNQYIIQNISKLMIYEIEADAKNFATISKYRLDISGATYESQSQPLTTNVITSNTTISLKTIDSRGLQGSLVKNYELFVDYEPPSITDFIVTRRNQVETTSILFMKASYSLITINGSNRNDVVSVKYRFKATNSTIWSDLVEIAVSIKEKEITFDNVIGNFDVDTSYNFEIQISDRANTSTASTILVVGKPILSIRKGGIGINKVPDRDRAIDVNGAIFQNGNPVLGYVNDSNKYPGFDPAIVANWFRAPASGLLPFKSGGSGQIGAASWPFNEGYFNQLKKGGVMVPNNNETPEILSGNGWNVLRFPSGIMVQTYEYTVTIDVSNPYGAGFYNTIPPAADYPIPFNLVFARYVTSQNNNSFIPVLNGNASLTNFTDKAYYYLYSFAKVTAVVRIYCLAVGRWKL